MRHKFIGQAIYATTRMILKFNTATKREIGGDMHYYSSIALYQLVWGGYLTHNSIGDAL